MPDNTLSAESSQVIRNYQGKPIEAITGGATRGINLFHSFQEFNIDNGRGAYFFSPNADIQNILARVTGKNPSEILGTLGTFGKSQPNLYLINPNGIVFGENASLDVGGSFVATTANAIQFGENNFFSASSPQVPSQLLKVNPSALLFNQINTASIQNNASRIGLQVTEGRSLLLVGGDVSMDGGISIALSGRIELGGLVEPGIVSLLMLNTDNSQIRIALAGHTGVGKTTLISTLRKAYSGEISPMGNTTKEAEYYKIPEYQSLQATFVDCPGFQKLSLGS